MWRSVAELLEVEYDEETLSHALLEMLLDEAVEAAGVDMEERDETEDKRRLLRLLLEESTHVLLSEMAVRGVDIVSGEGLETIAS